MQKKEKKQQNVRELLTETKNVSDLIIDLAYASILFEEDELALQVRGLENRMDELMYQIRAQVAIAVRNYKEAERTTGILQVASGAETISNAAGDLANLVLREIEIHPVVKEALIDADEKINKIKVGKNSQIIGEKLENLELPSRFAVWILAIKRDEHWEISPDEKEKIQPEDTLITRGPKDGITKLSYMADDSEKDWKVSRKYKRLRKFLSQMRDTGCSLVDMAFSSVLFKSKEVAEEVRELEQKFDEYNYEAWREVLKAAKREEDVTHLNSALQAVKSLENISDAADSIADVMLRGMELHPVFTQALEDAEERIERVEVTEDSSLTNRTLRELDLWKRTGVYVLVLKKGKNYRLNPRKETEVSVGDRLIIRGSPKGVKELIEVAKGNKKWKHLEI